MHDFIELPMKKILFILSLLAATTFSAKAQFTDFGVRAGVGYAYYADDIATNSPILAANVGGYISYGFTNSQSMLAEMFRLQTGVNLIRRGSHFEEVLQDILSVRQGMYSAWYVQVPLLASFRYELPVREPGHVGLLSFGPAFNYGLFGTNKDLIFTHGYPQSDWNHKFSKPVFDVISPIDVSFLLGVGYETQDLSVMLNLDFGCMSVLYTEDALRNDPNYNDGHNYEGGNTLVPHGNNCALLLTIGYKFPIR